MTSPNRISAPLRNPELPAHLYGTRAAIFFLMHPSRSAGSATSKSKNHRSTSNAEVSSASVRKASLHPAENLAQPKTQIPTGQATIDEFHFDFARLN